MKADSLDARTSGRWARVLAAAARLSALYALAVAACTRHAPPAAGDLFVHDVLDTAGAIRLQYELAPASRPDSALLAARRAALVVTTRGTAPPELCARTGAGEPSAACAPPDALLTAVDSVEGLRPGVPPSRPVEVAHIASDLGTFAAERLRPGRYRLSVRCWCVGSETVVPLRAGYRDTVRVVGRVGP